MQCGSCAGSSGTRSVSAVMIAAQEFSEPDIDGRQIIQRPDAHPKHMVGRFHRFPREPGDQIR